MSEFQRGGYAQVVERVQKASDMESIRVVVVEDEPLFKDLLVGAIISRIPIVSVVGRFSTAEECLPALASLNADVLLTDIDLGAGSTGVDLAIEARRNSSVKGVVLLSNLSLPNVISSVPSDVAGGWAYLMKTSVSNVDQVGRAILAAHRGEILLDESLTKVMAVGQPSPLEALTPRQFDVLGNMASGKSNKAIAAELGLTPRTVESVVSQIIANLGLREGSDGMNPRVASVLLYLEHVVPEGAVSSALPRAE